MATITKNYHLSHFGGVKSSDSNIFHELAHPQIREMITEQTYPDSNFANMPFTLILEDEPDFETLEKAINFFIEKNDSLRIQFTQKDYNYKQYIAEYQPLKLDFLDFSSEFARERFNKWLEQQVKKPFTLLDKPLTILPF